MKKAQKLIQQTLNELRRNSSVSITEIARALNRPITTVFEAEKKLRRQKIVLRYCASLDFEKLGFPLRVGFLLKIGEGDLDRVIRNLQDSIYVNRLQLLEGDCNLFVDAVFRKMEDLLEFREEIESEKTVYIISELKSEGARVT